MKCRRPWAFALLIATLLAACAPKVVTPPVVTSPRFPDFIFPVAPPGVGDAQARSGEDRGWQFLQAGDLGNAEREFAAVLLRAPTFYPAEAALGWVAVARRDREAALEHFDRVLTRAAKYVPALVGRGNALLESGKTEEAVASFRAALAVDPSLDSVRWRIEVLRFRSQEEVLATARKAAEAGRADEARSAYLRAISMSPDSGFLYRELAGVERKQGNLDLALEHLRKAAALDPGDARSLVQIGEVLEGRGDFDGAATAYRQASAIEPGEAIAARIEGVRRRGQLATLPPEYFEVLKAAQVTRGELAALIGVRLQALLAWAPRRPGLVITDARGHWAAPWVLEVATAGVMDVLPDHTFQPQGTIRREDLALAVNRLLDLTARRHPERTAAWRSGRPRIADVPSEHLQYPAVAAAVTSGVMPLLEGGTFGPSRAVSGTEVVAVVDRLEALAR
jgi:tetratricopeptide (TPR) repeat protein